MKPLLLVLLAQSVWGRAHPRTRDVVETTDASATVAPIDTTAEPRPHAPTPSEPTLPPGRAEPEIDWTLFAVRGIGVVLSVILLLVVVRKILGHRKPAIPMSDELAKAKHAPLTVLHPPGTLGRREPPPPSAEVEGDAQTDEPAEQPPVHAQEPEGGWDPTVVVGPSIGPSPAARAAAAAEMHLTGVWAQVHSALGHDRTRIEFHEGLGVWRAWADAPTFEQAVIRGDSRTKAGAVRVLRIVASGISRPAREFASHACQPSSREDLGDAWTAWAVNRQGGAVHAYQGPPAAKARGR